MRVLGEAGTVTMRQKFETKVKNKGVQCMFVGYVRNHDGDCYKMYNESTNKYYHS